MTCEECMPDAPYDRYYKCECGEHEFCRGCESENRGVKCPNKERIKGHYKSLRTTWDDRLPIWQPVFSMNKAFQRCV